MMRCAIPFLLVVLLGASPVLANPVAFDMVYIDFDPGNYVSQVYPAPDTTVEAYVMLDMTASGVGFTDVSFKLNVTPGMLLSPPVFESLLPGGATIGSWQSGITLTSTECIEPWEHPYPIARVTLEYISGSGAITIGDHPDYPRWVVDCYDGIQIYCVLWHGGIGQEAPSGDCEGQPVEEASWTAIKSLYR